MRKILSIGGMPGTGKTTLMRQFMAPYKWESVEPVKLVSSMYNPDLDLYVLGKYEDPTEVFAGSDKLSMAVQPAAIEFTRNTKSNILFEGDRLFSGTFIQHLFDLEDTEMAVFILETENAIREARYKERGSEQSDQFISGRRTKVANIEKNFASTNRVKNFQHNIPEDTDTVCAAIKAYLDGTFVFEKTHSSLDDFFG